MKRIICFLSFSIIFISCNSNSSSSKNSSSSEDSSCTGNGDRSCISKVRENFNNSGKQILGEEYLENGKFGISFLDPSRGESYNAEVFTDCNCNLTDVNVSVMY